MCVLPPTSINKKHSADFKVVSTEMSDHEKKVLWNRKRGFRMSTNARANQDLYKQVQSYILTDAIGDEELPYFTKLRRSLQTCCQHSLYRQYKEGGAVEYIASQTCKHKLCVVCNAERSKILRRKYLSYFKKGMMVDRKCGEIYQKEDFDYMHLTLTVPHSNDGFKGQKFYAEKLMAMFNTMRKCAWWNYYIFGGEFGIEVTKGENGLHIHIHSLLIVHKIEKSRNELQRLILMKWNDLTRDEAAKRKEFTAEQIAAIKKGTPNLTDDDFKFIDSTGATMVGLESLYIYSKSKISKYDRWNGELGKWKHYINANEENEFMSGVLECLKYHFEPVSFDKKEGVYNMDMLKEVLPMIYKKPLYRKFGNLHGVKELNVNQSASEETKEIVEEIGEAATNPNKEAKSDEFVYVIVSAKNVFFNMMKNLEPTIGTRCKKRIIDEQNIGLVQAVEIMIKMSIKSVQDAKKGFIHNT